jgi:hypothetical protein
MYCIYLVVLLQLRTTTNAFSIGYIFVLSISFHSYFFSTMNFGFYRKPLYVFILNRSICYQDYLC